MRSERLEGLLPSFESEQAAFDDMTPAGFPSTISIIQARLQRRQTPPNG